MRVVALGRFTPEDFVSSAEIHWASIPTMEAREALRVVVVDLRRAYEANGNAPIMAGRPAGPFPRFMRELPTMFIATPEALAITRDFAMACASAGLIAGAFTTERDALKWGLARARALEAQRASRRRK